MSIPHPLHAGDTVALLAPASPFAQPEKLECSVEALKAMGFRPEVFPSARASAGYLAGSDELRANDLNQAFSSDEISAIFCIRGGFGCSRILPLLDYEAIRRHPKMLIGLSDVTALHLAIYQKTGLSGLHAPMPFRYPELPQSAMQRLGALLTGKVGAHYGEAEGLRTLHGGESVTGRLLGGNLSLVTTLLASEYLPELEQAILFLEEVGEQPYRIDRLLSALSLAHVFERVRGVVFGGFTGCGEEAQIMNAIRSTLPESLPCITGFPAGHLQNNHGFFMGQRVTLSASSAELTFWEESRIGES